MDALTPWRPMRELETLRQRMDDMFGRLTREFFGPGWRERPRGEAEAWTPAIECQIANGNLVVKADLPGIDPKEVTISAVGNQLTIEGERKRDKKAEGKEYFYDEMPYGKFTRTLTLPEGVDADKVKADYKNGVLEITVPAPKQLVSKKIPIEIQQ
ncbi:MAG TPA: Hsp20/alpha crystallin family protein [Candidatus Binatia bacterium]|nr:Hsp20/alpha crystallin family protein [Candidatus Binatia bacterium]